MAAGVNPHRIGCLDNGSYFPLSHRTYYQRLRDYGYWTGYGEKLDLAKPREAAPLPYNRPDGLRPEDYSFGFCSPCKIAQTVADLESDNSPYGTYLKERGWYRDAASPRSDPGGDLGQAGLPPQENIDARSLVPVLSGERTSHRDHVLTALSHFRCVRSRTWKYIRSLNDIEELYDLEHNPQERENLAQAGGGVGKVRTRLARELDQLWRQGMWRR